MTVPALTHLVVRTDVHCQLLVHTIQSFGKYLLRSLTEVVGYVLKSMIYRYCSDQVVVKAVKPMT